MNIQPCFILHFDLLRSPQLDKPFMVRIDLGVEPVHIHDIFSIFVNDSMDTANMKGMLQMADLTPKRIWGQARENADQMDFEADSVGLMKFGKAVDYLHGAHHVGCDGLGPQVSTGGEDVRNCREVNRGAIQHRSAHGILRTVFGFFLPTDPESQDAEGENIQAVDDTATAQNLGSGCVVQDTSQLMGPLLVKALINFAKARAAAKAAGVEPANIGHGISMVFGLLIVILASICQHQFFFRSMIPGVLARTALAGALYRRAVHLTPAARLRLPNSAVLNYVSTDVSRAEACAQWFHAAWTAPIQTTVWWIILLVELRPSALADFALFLIIPLQERIMAHQFSLRQASMKWTDERAGRVLEVVASMRVVKCFCYEGSFLEHLFRIRTQELRGIRKIQHSQSANCGGGKECPDSRSAFFLSCPVLTFRVQVRPVPIFLWAGFERDPSSIALAFSLPVLAATLAFVTYTETSKQFDVAVVFASFSLFQVAIFAAVGLNGVNTAEIELILTYTTMLTQMFALSTRLSAEVENYMNSVERVVHYARGDVVPQEAAHESTPQNKPAADWPAHGAIEFKDVTMAYRPGLPNIRAGEKIGVVGRTGAGKLSLTLCLLRIVEHLGEIIVDGWVSIKYLFRFLVANEFASVNIGKIELTDLRSNIAIIPQEPILLSALDPFSKYDDARLWDALRRSYLAETRPFTLRTDTYPEAEPSGENRHQLTLNSHRDRRSEPVRRRAESSRSRACTGQRLARGHPRRGHEFGTPLNLFNRNESLFQSLCDKSTITSGDIEKAVISDDVE
ncbi:hypothetical protein B0H13DRAFT_2433724 [Mycena leptocephala]|nr:hypothetical protein B0H13DRAFT_2433724 [Mycena leptocephala]